MILFSPFQNINNEELPGRQCPSSHPATAQLVAGLTRQNINQMRPREKNEDTVHVQVYTLYSAVCIVQRERDLINLSFGTSPILTVVYVQVCIL